MVAGHFGVPVVVVTGDQYLASEAQALMPWVRAIEVKQAVARNAAACLPPARAHELIRVGVHQALEGLENARPLTVTTPVTVRLKLRDTGQAEAAARFPAIEVVDSLTVAYTGKDLLEAFRAVRSMIAMAHT